MKHKVKACRAVKVSFWQMCSLSALPSVVFLLQTHTGGCYVYCFLFLMKLNHCLQNPARALTPIPFTLPLAQPLPISQELKLMNAMRGEALGSHPSLPRVTVLPPMILPVRLKVAWMRVVPAAVALRPPPRPE